MTPPEPHPGTSDRDRRDFMPSIFFESAAAAIFWLAYACRATLGFDPLILFHRGDSITARAYFWFALAYTAAWVFIVAAKLHRARMLRTRGIETTGTITSVRGPGRYGWIAAVRYTVEGREFTVTRNRNTRPVVNATVCVVYDPKLPARCWIGFPITQANGSART